MPIEDFIIHVYCCVEEIYRQLVKTPLRRRGFQPKLTDSEAITPEIVGEFIGKDQDKSRLAVFPKSLACVVSPFRLALQLCQAKRQFMGFKNQLHPSTAASLTDLVNLNSG
jgi:hypothetical protein